MGTNKDFRSKQLGLAEKRRLTYYTSGEEQVHVFLKQGVDGIAYTFDVSNSVGRGYFLLAYRGKSIKPSHYRCFRSIDSRTAYMDKFFEQLQARALGVEKRKTELQEQKVKMAGSMVIGTILQGSWGYEQTNQEFYQVIERPSRFKAIIQEISYTRVIDSEEGDSCRVRPLKNQLIGKPITKLIGPWGISFEHFTLKPCDPNRDYHKSWGY